MVESSSEEQQDAAQALTVENPKLDNDEVMPAKGSAPLQFWECLALHGFGFARGRRSRPR